MASMATLTGPRRGTRQGLAAHNTRLLSPKLGMSFESPAICLKEAIAAALDTSIEEPLTPNDICPDHLHPLKAGAVKEFEKQLKQLHSENFELKLELYFRDQDKESGGERADSIEFIELQVKAENLRKELDYKNQLLRETLKTLQQLENKYGPDFEFCQSFFVPENHKAGEPLKRSIHHVWNTTAWLNEMSHSGDNSQEFEMTQNVEPELNFLLHVATNFTLDEKRDSNSLKNSLQDHLQKLDEPVKKKFLNFLRVLHHLKADLKEKDDKIKTLEMGKELASDFDSMTSSTSSFIKEPDVKLMEQELNSLHQAIRQKEVFIKELLDKQSVILEESKANTEHYIAVINSKDLEKGELENELHEKDGEVKQLLQKLEQMQQKVMQRSFDSQMFSDDFLTHSQLYSLDNDKEEMARKIQELQQIALTKEIQISETKLMLSTKDAELEVVQKNLKDAQNELVQLKAASLEKEKEMDSLRKSCLETEVRVAGIGKELEETLAKNEAMKRDLAEREKELFGSSTQLRHLSELLESEKKIASNHRPASWEAQGSEESSNCGTCTKDSVNRRARNLSGDLSLKRQVECKDAELHELRKKYKESVDRVLTFERELQLKAERICFLEGFLPSSHIQMTENVDKSQSERVPKIVRDDDKADSVISISSSLHRKSQSQDFSKFGQTNDMLELKEQIFLLMLRINQLEYDAKETTSSLFHQLEQSRAVCKLLHAHLEELADFMESLLQCENISRLIRSSLTADSLARMENLLSHGLDESLSLSRSIWMADATFDHLDMEPSRDRDLSIITVTSHCKGDVAIEEDSSSHEKISGRRSIRGGKLRLDRLDEMIQKGDKMCLELSHWNIQNHQLMRRLLNKLESSDCVVAEEVGSQLKTLRKRVEEMIAHCAKLLESFKTERNRKQLETSEKIEEIPKPFDIPPAPQEVSQLNRANSYGDVRNVRKDLEASRHDLNICLQELLAVQQKIDTSQVRIWEGNSSIESTDGRFGHRLLNVARQTVSILLQQILNRESAMRQKEVEFNKYHCEVGGCLQELKHIQQKVGSQASECFDEPQNPNELPRQLHQAIRKMVKNLLQQMVEKESALKLGRERISELERAIEGKKREVKQLQEWNVELRKENCRDDEVVDEQLRDVRERLANVLQELEEKDREMQNNHSKWQKDIENKSEVERQLEEEKNKFRNVVTKINALEDEIADLKVANSNELQVQQETSRRIVDKLKENNDQLKAELQQTKQHYDDLRSQVLILKSEMECVSHSDTDLKEKDAAIRSLEFLVSNMRHQVELLTEEKRHLEEKERNATLELEEKAQMIASLQNVISSLKREVEKLLKRHQMKDNQAGMELQEKERLNQNLQVSLAELRLKLENVDKEHQGRLQVERQRHSKDLNEKNQLIQSREAAMSDLQEQMENLKKENTQLENACKTLERDCAQQRSLLENKVSKDAEMQRSNQDLQEDVEVHKQMLKQMEEWNVGIQQQIQQKERLWTDERDRMKQENHLLKKKVKKFALKKGTDSSSVEYCATIQRLQEELKEASQVNASLQLEMKVYQHLGQNSTSCEDSHQTEMLLELVQEMRQLRGELMRSVRANTKLQHRLEQYVEQDSKVGMKADHIVATSHTSSTDSIPKLICSPSLEAIATQLPSRFSSDSSLHMRVRQLLAPTCGDSFSSSNEDLRSVYSSPDLGIESDPNRDSSSTASGHHVTSSVSNSAQLVSFAFPEKLGEENSLHAVGNLQAFESLQKQVCESLVVLKGMKARLQDQLHRLSNSSSPSKNAEYNTLKELDRSCYFMQVYLEKSRTLLATFRAHPQISPLLEENSILREEVVMLRNQVREQNVQLQKALEKLAISKNKKDGMERAITKQLSKTRKVLKQAKCNLLEENLKQNSQQT